MTAVFGTNGLLQAGGALSTASTPVTRAALLNDSLVGFLVLLVVLLVLSLIVIIRLEPPERTAVAEETPEPAVPAPAYAGLGLPVPPTGHRQVASAPLPVRPVGQQPTYAPRHGYGPVTNPGITTRPRVTGGPPWGPAPRPPDADPFARSSDWRTSG
ncbi:MAG TPA: hypothetical protein VMA32_03330 [Streptosporangiaceae bacterium]|nr:hypothetical protein [Streptosporangiaceae bacterium]